MSTRHLTLAANAPTTVVFGGTYSSVAVFNTGNVAADVWVSTKAGVNPVAAADGTYRVPAGSRRVIEGKSTIGEVRLLSTGAVTVEVEYA
jgi:hypothetical protein